MKAQDPRIGTDLAGYRIEALLGHGGMGVVYRAEDTRLGRQVALKLLSPERGEDGHFRERFLAESRLAASIEHPNILPVHEAGEAGGALYIAMRYVEGTDLRELLGTEGKLAPARALAICRQLASALDAAHARGLVHRDVKPSNVLVSRPRRAGDEHAYLCDFGVGKRTAAPQELTRTGQLVGTPNYIAPEQIEGTAIDGRADEYALASLLFECLAGEPPHRRESDYATLWATIHEPAPSLVALRPELPVSVDAVIQRGLAKQPGARYRSCTDFIEAIASALAPERVSAERATPALADLDEHFATVVRTMLEGRLVPFIGQAANLCGRPGGTRWERDDRRWLPDGADLAAYLARQFDYPLGEARDLERVAQYAAVMKGTGPLYDELHDVLDVDYRPGPIHTFLGELACAMRERGGGGPLVVTTNYDQALERALDTASEPYDVVSYIAVGRNRGRFSHLDPDSTATVVQVPNTYDAVSTNERTVVLKIHGQVDRTAGREWESFVVAEDDHLDYLSGEELAGLIPVKLALKLRRSHFLFLGVSVREWTVRGLLHHIWGEHNVSYRSWAVQLRADPLEGELWRRREVDVIALSLDDYVEGLRAHLAELRASQAQA